MARALFHPRPLTACLAVLVSAAACATIRPAADAPEEPVVDSRMITPDEIARTNATNALDALRMIAGVRLGKALNGRPTTVNTRGPGTFLRDDSPVVLLDGVRLDDFRYLRFVEAHTISSIELVTGVQGTLRYGTGSGAGAGAIVITTRAQ